MSLQHEKKSMRLISEHYNCEKKRLKIVPKTGVKYVFKIFSTWFGMLIKLRKV